MVFVRLVHHSVPIKVKRNVSEEKEKGILAVFSNLTLLDTWIRLGLLIGTYTTVYQVRLFVFFPSELRFFNQ